LNDDIQQIKKDLQDFLLRLQKNENLLSEIIHKNNEDHIIPLLRRDFTGIIRVDIVLNAENKLKILEINADYPD
jgi:D-alanine-D-alanine ligase-like ATP-grasp enzyme